MREPWVTELLADAPAARPEFREQLRSRVLDAWGGREQVDVADPEPRRHRVWPVLAAAAVVAVLVAGLVVLTTDDRPTGQVPSDTSPMGAALTASDVVGVWVVTELDGGPAASPLPTYRFTADGNVSGFDGCNLVATTWSVEDGRLRFGDTGESTTGNCQNSNGTPVPTVAPGGGTIETIDGAVTMLFDHDGTTARARLVGDLDHPARLRGTTWTLGVDGPDLRIRFGDDLTAGIDDVDDCGRTSYTYHDGSLRFGHLEGAAATCAGTHLRDFEAAQTIVVNYTDAYSPSILFVPPTGGAIRLVPGAAVEETVEATPPVPVTMDDLNGRTFLIDSLRIRGQPQPVLADPLIYFDLDNLWVEAGCNTMHTVAPYEIRDNRLVIAELDRGDLPCASSDLAAQEQALHRLVTNSPTVTALNATTLWLQGAGIQLTAVDTDTLSHPVRTTVPPPTAPPSPTEAGTTPATVAGTASADSATERPITSSPLAPTTAAVEGLRDPAVWVLKPGELLTGASQSFTAFVTRLGCSNGVTGEVLDPTVEISDAEVVVTFTVKAAPGGDCPSNDQVPFVVDVGEPIGDRRLLDGACRPTGEAASTSFCANGGVRN